jgi:hypothetical protein
VLPDTRAAETARLLSRHRVDRPSSPAGRLPLGIVTDRDSAGVVAEGRDATTTRAADIMTAVIIASARGLRRSHLEMTRREIRHLAAVETGACSAWSRVRLPLGADFTLSCWRGRSSGQSLTALAALGPRVVDLARRLVKGERSTSASSSPANDRMVGRVLPWPTRVWRTRARGPPIVLLAELRSEARRSRPAHRSGQRAGVRRCAARSQERAAR